MDVLLGASTCASAINLIPLGQTLGVPSPLVPLGGNFTLCPDPFHRLLEGPSLACFLPPPHTTGYSLRLGKRSGCRHITAYPQGCQRKRGAQSGHNTGSYLTRAVCEDSEEGIKGPEDSKEALKRECTHEKSSLGVLVLPLAA